MADEAQTVIEATAGAATQAIEAAGEAAKETTATAVKTSKRATAKVAKTTRRQAKATRSAVKTARRAKPRRKTKATVARKPAAQERIETVTKNNNNWFAGFNALPNTGSFQTLFADAGERGQEVARRSQKAIEELAEVSRANVEALVDAGKIAVKVSSRPPTRFALSPRRSRPASSSSFRPSSLVRSSTASSRRARV